MDQSPTRQLHRDVVQLLGLSTADIVAFERAWHEGAGPSVLRDPWASSLCGPALGLALRFRPLAWMVCSTLLREVMPASMVVVVRARHVEQALERSIREDGIVQYVILGAGMDSFAFRRPDLMQHVEVFEIDHPREQVKKFARLRRAGLPIARSHHFIAADLSSVSPPDALAESPFDPARPAFFSMLGVAYYLTLDAIAETVRLIAADSPPGTRIAVDYLLDGGSCDPAAARVRQALLELVQDCGEPMLNACSLEQVEAIMSREGLETIESFAVADLEPALRAELGDLLFPIPDIFGLGLFRVA